MKRKTYHVTRVARGWRIKLAGATRVVSVYPTKAQAIDLAKTLAKCWPLGQVKVHGVDGKIQTEYTYGKDPRRFRG